ncbi:MAG: Rid family hydrolase [Pseudomonadales bacterium]|nr:Rid family hydrolase [Pseudomonadales bacterium]
MPRKVKQDTVAEVSEQAEEVVTEDEVESKSVLPQVSNFNLALITGLGLAVVIVVVRMAGGGSTDEVAAVDDAPVAEVVAAVETASAAAPIATSIGGIERKGEGRHFYTTIKIPAGAETLYLSGSGASRKEDGIIVKIEEQTRSTFANFKTTLEAEGWSMSDIVQVRAFAVAGEYGVLDFDGFNRAYREFFGSEDNPLKPVRSFVQIAGLVVPGWLVEIEIRAVRVP